MIAPRKPGVVLARLDGPMIETKRLILRTWREADVAPNTAMLSDPETARYITADRKAVTDELNGWRNAAIMSGHWALHGFGMFVVEEKASGSYVGRVGPWCPPRWPGFEVGWGIAKQFRGKGYATEGARAVLAFARDELRLSGLVSYTAPSNVRSIRVMETIGLRRDERDDFEHPLVPEGHPLRRHVLYRTPAGFQGRGTTAAR